MTLKSASPWIRLLSLCGLGFAVACASDVTSPGREAKPAFVQLEPGTVAQVSAGAFHTCALRTDGTVACWGSNVGRGEGFSGEYLGQATPPMGTFTQVSAGGYHTCGLRSDGTVACWGSNGSGEATPPSGTFTHVSAGGFDTCGLESDHSVACWGRYAIAQTPNQPPTASFTYGCNGLTCSFTSTSSDPDGSIAAYSWTFGDGDTSTAQNPSHTYAAGGTYAVMLTVTDDRGATASASQSVTVSPPNQAPTVNAGSDQTVLLGLFYTLNASFSDPDNGPWSYTINWGDGSSSSGSTSSTGTGSATHNYVLIGSYTIRVTVTDSRGASGSDTKVLTVFTSLGGIL